MTQDLELDVIIMKIENTTKFRVCVVAKTESDYVWSNWEKENAEIIKEKIIESMNIKNKIDKMVLPHIHNRIIELENEKNLLDEQNIKTENTYNMLQSYRAKINVLRSIQNLIEWDFKK